MFNPSLKTLLHRLNYFLLGFLLVSFSSGIIGCQGLGGKAPEIKIGLIAPLTGDVANTTGKSTLQGAQLAVQEVNEKGGLRVGRQQQKINLMVKDDRDNPDGAVSAATTLINRDHVVALVGIPFSRNAIPVAKVAEAAQIPAISSQSTNLKTTANKKYVFRIPFVDSFQGRVMADFAYNQLNLKKAAVLYDIASEYNRGLAEVFQQEFERYGGKMVAVETYTTDRNQDFENQLKRIIENQAEVLFLPNYNNDIPRQAEQARKLGYKGQLLGSDSWSAIASEQIPKLQGAFFSSIWSPDLQTPETLKFIEAYRRTYNQIPNSSAATTYDAMNLLFSAIQRQGKAEPEAIRQGLEKSGKYTGVTGTLEYHGTGDPSRSAVILQVQDNQFVTYQQVSP